MNLPTNRSAPSAGAAAVAASRIRAWLLSPRVQLRSGPQTGAVAGALDCARMPRYVYPEITGYYLHWLAETGATNAAEIANAAAMATEWSARQFAHAAVPLTRTYLQPDAVADWRNDAVFFFDLAMLLRGLCAAVETGLVAAPVALLRRIVAELDAFVAEDASIRAARIIVAGAALPARWSTQGGPFEVKASSRVALAAKHVELPERLERACERMADRYAGVAATVALDMLHPTLYFAEGLLVARPATAPDLARLLHRILRLQRNDGALPESESESQLPRSDIIAQALRVGLLLHDRKVAGAPDEGALAALADALLGRIGADGSVCFRTDIEEREPNVWCSLFTEQALRWYALWRDGAPLPGAEWLV